MFVFALTVLLVQYATADFTWNDTTPLDTYIHSDDGYFTWSEITSYRFENISVTLHILNMTSQKWFDDTLSSRSIWWHYMGIAIPDEILHPDAAMLWIDGGSNDDEPPERDELQSQMVTLFANDVGCVAGYILQVPNQEIIFYNDPSLDDRYEDDIIAWTWKLFMGTDDAPTEYIDNPDVILRFPMAKAGKRAMDTMNEFGKQISPDIDLQRFMVTGLSKRGWTTWTLTATDRRVVAAMPMVMSLLNYLPALMAHYQALGNWSFAFEPYYNEGLTKYVTDPRTDALMEHEDMFRYKPRYAGTPILLVAATGDEFFFPQDLHYWWDQMPGPMWLHMLPNAEHSLTPWYLRVYDTGVEWWNSLLNGYALPNISWTRSTTATGGQITMLNDMEPYNMSLWTAYTLENDTRRDYRLFTGYEPYTHPVLWLESEDIIDLGNGVYEASVDDVDERWAGFMIQNFYYGPLGKRLYLTTGIHVTPDTFPYPPCDGLECEGDLV